MSRKSVYEAVKVRPGDEPRMTGFANATGKKIYEGTIRRTAAKLGYPDVHVPLKDDTALQKISAFNKEITLSMVGWRNFLLGSALNQVPGILGNEAFRGAAAEALARMAVYDREALFPYVADSIAAIAYDDFFTFNQIQSKFQVVGEDTGSGPCSICGPDEAKGVVDSLAEFEGESYPLHRFCRHRIERVEVQTADMPSPESLWRGGEVISPDATEAELGPQWDQISFGVEGPKVNPDILDEVRRRATGGPVLRAGGRPVSAAMSERRLAAKAWQALLRKEFNPDQPRDDHGRWSPVAGEALPPSDQVSQRSAAAVQTYVKIGADAVPWEKRPLGFIGGASDLIVAEPTLREQQAKALSDYAAQHNLGALTPDQAQRFEQAWMVSAQGPLSLALQQAVMEQHDIKPLEDKAWGWQSVNEGVSQRYQAATGEQWTDKTKDAVAAMAGAQYGLTQEWYRDHPEASQVAPDGTRYVELYRGIQFAAPREPMTVEDFGPKDSPAAHAAYDYALAHPITTEPVAGFGSTPIPETPASFGSIEPGKTESGTADLFPLSSWTLAPETARPFGYTDNLHDGYVLSAKVPVSRIFSNGLTGMGVPGEAEHIILGGALRVAVTRKAKAY